MKRPNISNKLKEKIRQSARHRCGFCLFSEIYSPTVFQFDHIIPLGKGGTNDEENFWLVCESCNRAKSDKTESFDSVTNSIVSIFNPRTQIWSEHFEWSDDFTRIIGKTPTGRITVIELNLNRERTVEVRRNWVSADWHPPKD